MKPLFFLLLFANIAFLGWKLFIGDPSRELPVVTRGPGIPVLKLAVESSAPTSAGAAPVAGRRCVTVGPFLEAVQVDRAAQLLRSEHLSPRQRSLDQPAGTAFVVALIVANEADAARTQMRLRSAGVKDVAATTAGAGVTRLVFGRYATHAEADTRVTTLRKFGVDPAIVEEPRSVPTYWLDVDLAAGDRPVDVAAIQATVGGAASLVLQTCEPTPGSPAPTQPPRGSAPVGPPKSASTDEPGPHVPG